MYGMEVSFKVSALKNKIFISWLVVVLTPSALAEVFFVIN